LQSSNWWQMVAGFNEKSTFNPSEGLTGLLKSGFRARNGPYEIRVRESPDIKISIS